MTNREQYIETQYAIRYHDGKTSGWYVNLRHAKDDLEVEAKLLNSRGIPKEFWPVVIKQEVTYSYGEIEKV